MKKVFLRSWARCVDLLPFLGEKGFQQFLRFGVIGVSNTAVDIGGYLLLTRVLNFRPLTVASALSFTLAASWSYVWNKRWTFDDQRAFTFEQFGMFFLTSLGGLLIHTASLWIAVDVLHVYDLIGKFFAVAFSIIWNFFINKYWTFRHLLP
ncbi:MAG: GtrA family protein [Candidatus Kerfeldbacteria bacterium]|nr:GtrA family protein [Candidatus Kerfeldbacteria bacterium]